MDLFTAIDKRHSYRGPFGEKRISREELRRIVQAGIQAPSGLNAQTTSFVIVDDPDLVSQISSMHTTNTAFQQARAFIACVMDRDPQPVYQGNSFEVEDCSAAVENMLLAVTALGYATVWVDGWLRREDRADTIGSLLGIPEEKVIRVILPLGVPLEVHKQKEKKPLEERAWFNRYGHSV